MEWLGKTLFETSKQFMDFFGDLTGLEGEPIEEEKMEEEETPQVGALEEVSISEELREFVENLSENPELFENFPLEVVDTSKNQFKMSKKQERHVQLVLEEVPSLNELRFKMVPEKMTDEDFWKIYFALVRNKIGETLDRTKSHDMRDETLYLNTRKPNLNQILENEVKTLSIWSHEHLDGEFLKDFLWRGIPDCRRAKAWMYFLKVHKETALRDYEIFMKELANEKKEIMQYQPSTSDILNFNQQFRMADHCLSEKGKKTFCFILNLIQNCKSLTKSKVLPDLTAIFLTYMNEAESFQSLRKWMELSRFHTYNSFDSSELSGALFFLLEHTDPELYQHLKDLEVDLSFGEQWFTRFYFGSLPFQTATCVVDNYLHEGVNFLFKVGIGILTTLHEQIMQVEDALDYVVLLEREIPKLQDSQMLMKKSQEIKLKENQIRDALMKARVATLPNFEGLSTIANVQQMATLWYWLPPSLKLREPQRLFRSSIDGFNLHILLEKCMYTEHTILLIKTKKQEILGAFITQPWEKSNAYKGSGEMFVFALYPEVKRFSWTKANTYFFRVTAENLMIGGGTGCAISIDDELDKGSSQYSETFGNDPLTSTDFECVELEVFAIE